jgi:2'-hydroxyisoflavone reductase
MRILVIGGTSFVGRAITEAAVTGGHEVSVFNRGRTAPGDFAHVERLVGDRDSDLSALAGDRSWDATIDVCAYVPRQVRTLLDTLGGRGGHYTFISTVSVYRDDVPAGYDESAPLREPSWDDTLTMELYGELKVGCEHVAAEIAGESLLIVRPGYVVGPHDPTHRFTYWVERVAEGRSPMAGPDPEQPLQVVDARDLGQFTLDATVTGRSDTVHVVGPRDPITFGDAFRDIAAAAGSDVPQTQPLVDDRLPLVIPADAWSLETADPGRSASLGMTWRPLTDTARDTLEWVRSARAAGTYQPRPGVGLSPAEERDLLG